MACNDLQYKWTQSVFSKKAARLWFYLNFVLCDADSLEIVTGIELDDASHQREHRMQRDRFVNAAFDDAGIPLLRIPVQKRYDARDLRKLIDKAV